MWNRPDGLLDSTGPMFDNVRLRGHPHSESRVAVSDRRNLLWFCATPLIAVGLLLLVLLSGNAPGPVIPGFLWGTLFGHTTLAAVWTAFGPLPLLWRLPLALLWLVALPVTIFCNLRLHSGTGDGVFAVVVAACLAGQYAFLQLPFWGLVLTYRLRLRYSEATSMRPDPRETQFGIRQLMIFTTIVAIVLGAGRFAITYLPSFAGHDDSTPALIFLAVAAIVVTLPLILAALLPRLSILAVGVVLVLIGLFTAFELPLWNRFTSSGIQESLLFVFINGFTSAWILAIALIVRFSGYRFGRPGIGVESA